jgi:hypothetical protein
VAYRVTGGVRSFDIRGEGRGYRDHPETDRAAASFDSRTVPEAATNTPSGEIAV